MATLLLLIVIYIAFISLGLPDAILGVAWPEMRLEFGMALDAQGVIFIAATISTILSSLASGYLIKKFGTFQITLCSVLLTATALLGISFVPSFYWIIFLALPLGFGAGSIDTALNNYVAVHYQTHHMNWLHAFWGIGASLGPIVMSSYFALHYSWRNGYRTLAIVQLVFFTIILLSYPLWKKHKEDNRELIDTQNGYDIHYKDVLKTKGVLLSMMLFVIYCAIEFSIGQWGASYLVEVRTLLPATAGTLIGVYYAGITIGRITSGFVSFKITNKQLIIIGILIFTIASTIFFITVPFYILYIGFFLQGLGLAPIFPSLTHETPRRFGKEKSQHVIGFQMASAYLGASIFPALFGLIARLTDISIYPYYLVLFGIIMYLVNKQLNVKTKER